MCIANMSNNNRRREENKACLCLPCTSSNSVPVQHVSFLCAFLSVCPASKGPHHHLSSWLSVSPLRLGGVPFQSQILQSQLVPFGEIPEVRVERVVRYWTQSNTFGARDRGTGLVVETESLRRTGDPEEWLGKVYRF